VVSIGLLVRDEESRLPATLASLFRQTLFAELDGRGQRAEIWCVAHACADNTAAVAERIFQEQARTHPHAGAFLAHAVSLAMPGHSQAWNLFTHEISSRETRCLILLDASIRLGHVTTLWHLVTGLQRDMFANVTTGSPIHELTLKESPTWRDRLTLLTTQLMPRSEPPLTRQLYCIRAETARQIRFPRDLAVGEDLYLEKIVSTDLLRHSPSPARIRKVTGASYVFAAETGVGGLLRQCQRQWIGQACAHGLLNFHLKFLAFDQDGPLADIVRELDEESPDWMRRVVGTHVRNAGRFWNLFPDAGTFSFRCWAKGSFGDRIRTLPSALTSTLLSLLAASTAAGFLRATALAPAKSMRDALAASAAGDSWNSPRHATSG